MKLIKLLLVCVIGFAVSISASAASSIAEQIATNQSKLKSFTMKNVEADRDAEKKGKKNSQENLDKMLEALSEGVKLLSKKKAPADLELMAELCRVAVLTFELDPSLYASEVLLPLFEKDPILFDKAVRRLPKDQAKELSRAMKNTLREMKEGNG